jgi:Putative Flp pilus-assembly TadE/G-like
MLRRLVGDENAAISIIAALSLAAIIGISSLAVEFGHGLLERSENQRTADLAAYGAALVYNSTGSSTDAAAAAANIAALNGISSSGAAASIVSSPTGDGNQALEVTVTTSLPLYLARVLTKTASLSIGSSAYAEMEADAPGCIIALASAGSGIVGSGGTSVTADNCAVASNSAVNLSGSAKITTKTVDYSSSYSVSGGASIVSPSGGSASYAKATTTDPLAGNSNVATAAARISSVAAITSASAPSVTIPSGSAVTFKTTGVTGLPSACSDTYNSSTKVYTVTCSGTADFGLPTVTGVTVTLNTSSGNTYNFSSAPPSSFTIAGSGGTYGFNYSLSPSGTTTYPAGTYNINGSISPGGGATTTFGAGTYNVTGGFVAGGGSTTTFGAGTYNFGTTTCNGTSGYSICNTGTNLTFDGPSTFTLAGGIYNGGGASLYLGYSTTSSITNGFDIGKAGDGNAINVGTSQTMLLGNTTDSADTFEAAGNITSGGGSCLELPPAGEHDINGNMNFEGGVYLGAGIYTMDGYFAMGASSGGNVSNCPTASFPSTGLNAVGVTLVVSGTQSVTCNGVASTAFCLGAGYSTVDLTAPTSGATEDLAVIGPQSASYTSGAAFTTGATNTEISGAFYFPHGPVTMSGGAALADTGNSSACLELIGSEVSLSGGSAAASTCTGLGGSSTGSTVALVQ